MSHNTATGLHRNYLQGLTKLRLVLAAVELGKEMKVGRKHENKRRRSTNEWFIYLTDAMLCILQKHSPIHTLCCQ
jgi:hypothetical protein